MSLIGPDGKPLRKPIPELPADFKPTPAMRLANVVVATIKNNSKVIDEALKEDVWYQFAGLIRIKKDGSGLMMAPSLDEVPPEFCPKEAANDPNNK